MAVFNDHAGDARNDKSADCRPSGNEPTSPMDDDDAADDEASDIGAEEARQLLARALPVMLHHCSMLPASFTAWPAEFDELDGDASLRSSRDFARASRDLNGEKGSSRQTPPLDNDDYATISSSV